MQLENPLFRKVIVPWYDSDFACIATIVFMAVIFLFSLTGISVALKVASYGDHTWVPVLLLIMSLLVLVSNFGRLITRITARMSSDEY